MLNVDFYHKCNGECPVLDYLKSLSPYFFIEGKTAILTNGFTKKTQKTPVREIKKANLYRSDYYAQNNGKE